MGWKEGEGLGASKQGIKTHIKVKKKFENWGVGAVSAARLSGWLRGVAAGQGVPALPAGWMQVWPLGSGSPCSVTPQPALSLASSQPALPPPCTPRPIPPGS